MKLEKLAVADPMIEAEGENVPEGGSLAGGYLYVVSGFGLVPFGGLETVTVTFGEYPYSMACAIVDISFDYISCLVPDFSQYKGSDTKKIVPVSIYLGYDQLTPVLELEQMTYTFDDDLTPSASSLSPNTITTSELISIGGTNFGTSIQIFLRNKNAPSVRRRRSLPDPIVETHVVQKREIHEFWTKFTNSEEPTWRCMHGKQCNHDDVSFMPSSLDRKKREIPENWKDIKEQEAEDDEAVLNAVCMVDATKCNDMLNDLFSAQS
jgi:hypothetical protein